MSVLTYTDLVRIVRNGVLIVDENNINGASIDITLGDTLFVEVEPADDVILDPSKKSELTTEEVIIPDEGFVLYPGQCVLGSSIEIFNLPDSLAAEYKLKSSLARIFLGHMLAGWCDPTWQNSSLTLELFNQTQYHPILLTKGMKIGQMVFLAGTSPVPPEHSYMVRGQYNNQGVTADGKTAPVHSKGAK